MCGKYEWGSKKETQHKTTLKDRAVLLPNSHAGEGPAQGAGPSPRLLEEGLPSGRITVLFPCFSVIGQCVPGALLELMELLWPQAPETAASQTIHEFKTFIIFLLGRVKELGHEWVRMRHIFY